MGKLVEGKWVDEWYDTKSTGGKFVRPDTKFRGQISSEEGAEFPAEKDRYHLYVSMACPWAHRALIFRKLKGLEDYISLSVVHPFMGENGWTFQAGDGVIPDSVNEAQYLYQVYLKAQPDYSGRVTVPTLWDKKQQTIVNNESAEIIRFLNSELDHLTHSALDFYPADLKESINEINDKVYHSINNGVYKTGFATSQDAYEKAFQDLFQALDDIEIRLQKNTFLCGERLTEADWRLFTTLIRFDLVYYGHFKCNRQHIYEYPELNDYLKTLFQIPGVSETCNFEHIKNHYYQSHETINPTRIVPLGPELNFEADTRRGPIDLKKVAAKH